MNTSQDHAAQKNEQTERFAYVVVDCPGVNAIARAWVFDDEEDAVKFRCERLEPYSRRANSLTPVFKCKPNHVDMLGNMEIDWKKYPLPKKETAKKFM